MTHKITPECIGCEGCLDSCPTNAIKMEGDLAVIVADDCIDCGACVSTCPVDAIKEG